MLPVMCDNDAECIQRRLYALTQATTICSSAVKAACTASARAYSSPFGQGLRQRKSPRLTCMGSQLPPVFNIISCVKVRTSEVEHPA